MPRTAAASVLVSELPAYLRDVTSANLVAVALEAQARATYEAADNAAESPVIEAGIRAQADAYQAAAAETRLTAKTIAGVEGGA